ncbi:hypothetical protein LG315_03465 [Microbacterium marinum]|uniref:hypothetical protein n=1 Tax=Microbacterium marinum TaxID=421115 RepID=UPI00384F548F
MPTHYEVEADALVQVLDHQTGEFAYPIVADPSLVLVVVLAAGAALAIWGLMAVFVNYAKWRDAVEAEKESRHDGEITAPRVGAA